MTKRVKRKTLKNKANKLWKEAIWERDDDKCQYCGMPSRNAHHVVGKANHRLRWELLNGLNLCPKHHTFDTKFSAHGTPTIFAEWFKKTYPYRNTYIKKYVNEVWDKDYDKVFKGLKEVI